MVLFNRFFRDIDNVNQLTDKIEELTKIINKDNTLKLLNSYYKLVKENIYIMPDIEHINMTSIEYDKQYFSLADITEKSLRKYYNSMESRMPFYLGETVRQGNTHKFNWDVSYDLQSDEIIYDFILSRDVEFNDIVVSYTGLNRLHCNVDNIQAGTYYWKVIARDVKGNWQEAFDKYIYNNESYYGCKQYIVN